MMHWTEIRRGLTAKLTGSAPAGLFLAAGFLVAGFGFADTHSDKKQGLHLSQYAHRTWTAADGLPTTHIRDIVQTEDGLLWLATTSGFAQFDGSHTTIFNLVTTPEMISEDLKTLDVGPDQSVWVGFQGGGLLQYLDGEFTRHTIVDGRISTVSALLFDDAGTLWIGSNSGLFRKSPTGTIDQTGIPDVLRTISVWALFGEADGTIWIGTKTAGLFRLRQGKLNSFSVMNGLSSNSIHTVLRDRNGVVWVGTAGGLDRIEPDGAISSFSSDEGMTRDGVWELIEDHQGRIWVGSEHGLIRIDADSYEFLTAEDGILSDPRIRALFEDRDGRIWIGHYPGELTQLWRGPVVTYSTNEGLAENFVTSVVVDNDNTTWLTTFSGVIQTITNLGVTTVLDLRENGHPGITYSIAPVGNGESWIGTDNGLFHLTNDGLDVLTIADGLPSDRVRVVYVDPIDPSTLWVGTIGKGLCVYRNGRFTRIGVAEGLSGEDVQSILRNRKGDLWWGVENGLNLMSGDRITSFTSIAGIPVVQVHAIHESDDQTMWFGIGNGMVRFRDGEFKAFTTRDGLFQNLDWSILEHNGFLWSSSDEGIQRIPRDALSERTEGSRKVIPVQILGAENGMKNSECNGVGFPSGSKDRDNNLWFPTMDGVVRVDPQSSFFALGPPHAIITRVHTGLRSVASAPADNFPNTHRELEIEYTAPVFITPQPVLFSYKLEGYDDNWVNVGERRTAYFTNLSAGNYVFHVRATYDSGSVGEAATFTVSFPPHFYETWWFFLLALVTFLGITVWFVILLLRRQQTKTLIAEAELEKAREALVRRTRFTTIGHLAANIAHELKNPLGAARNSTYLVKRLLGSAPGPKVEEHLEIINKEICIAVKTIDEILAMTRDNPPEKRNIGVALIATDMFERGSDEHDDLRLELDIEPSSMTVFADPAQLNQVLTNLMSNAAHAMNHSGTIRLWARSSADHDTIRITDDGPGIPEEKREHIFEALFTTKAKGSGLGLTICRQIVGRHGGTIALEESKNPNHRGATFRIILPRNALDIDDLNNSTISARERQQNPETRTNRTH